MAALRRIFLELLLDLLVPYDLIWSVKCRVWSSDRLTQEPCFWVTQEEAHVTPDHAADFISVETYLCLGYYKRVTISWLSPGGTEENYGNVLAKIHGKHF
jgi:hypothetical protein